MMIRDSGLLFWATLYTGGIKCGVGWLSHAFSVLRVKSTIWLLFDRSWCTFQTSSIVIRI